MVQNVHSFLEMSLNMSAISWIFYGGLGVLGCWEIPFEGKKTLFLRYTDETPPLVSDRPDMCVCTIKDCTCSKRTFPSPGGCFETCPFCVAEETSESLRLGCFGEEGDLILFGYATPPTLYRGPRWQYWEHFPTETAHNTVIRPRVITATVYPPPSPRGEGVQSVQIWTIPFSSPKYVLISKSYSEHVSSVEKCRRCVFEHQNTIWSKETTYFWKKFVRSFFNFFTWPPVENAGVPI